jgi:Tfp pilus assembly protein PilN
MAILGIKDVAGLFVQGRVDEALADRVRQEMKLEVKAAPGAPPDAATYSLALALSARKKDQDRIDLFRSTRPPPSLAQVFPRRLAAGMVAAAAFMALVLWYNLSDLQEQHQSLCCQNASYVWAEGQGTDAIAGERKNLAAEVDAVQKFLGTRVIWSNYLRDLPTRLPSNACLHSFHGQYELKNMGKNVTQRPNQSLTICGMARFTDRGSAPKEIDAFLESLRGAEALKRTFPIVHLAEIKWRKEAAADIALFTILATPAEKAGGKDEAEDKPAASNDKKAPAHG